MDKQQRLAIMQPYFFPYLGYISLIKQTDRFILFDSVQFIRHGWIERNRILKQNEGWIYIQVPLVKHSRETQIKDIQINNLLNWKQKIISQLVIYKKWAPNYYKIMKLISNLFERDYNSIVDLNKKVLEMLLEYLEINRKIEVFSEMNLQIDSVESPDEWALKICKSLPKIKEYWNPPGGASFFDREKYEKEKIELKFQKIRIEKYDQKRVNFEGGLSIIDVLMFNSIKDVNLMLDKFELI